MKQEDSWTLQWLNIINYLDEHKSSPSKHRPEDHKMVNWIKYNKKLMARGLLPEGRVSRFNMLLEKMKKYQRVNQYAYRFL